MQSDEAYLWTPLNVETVGRYAPAWAGIYLIEFQFPRKRYRASSNI